jgi:hypothetical protein
MGRWARARRPLHVYEFPLQWAGAVDLAISQLVLSVVGKFGGEWRGGLSSFRLVEFMGLRRIDDQLIVTLLNFIRFVDVRLMRACCCH